MEQEADLGEENLALIAMPQPEQENELPLGIEPFEGDMEIIPEERPIFTAEEQTQLDRGLLEASREGRAEDVTALLEKGANPNFTDAKGYTALMLASWGGETKIVTALLKKGANPNIANDYNNTALIIAAMRGHKELVAKLIAARANVNADASGKTDL